MKIISNLTAPARIASFGQLVRKAVGTALILECLAVGNPTPRARWLTRDRPVTFSPFYEVTNEGNLKLHRKYDFNNLYFIDMSGIWCMVYVNGFLKYSNLIAFQLGNSKSNFHQALLELIYYSHNAVTSACLRCLATLVTKRHSCAYFWLVKQTRPLTQLRNAALNSNYL